MSQEHRYSLSDNDLAIIKEYNGDKPLSENARKTLIILSEVFGGLHHLDYDQLKFFEYQSTFFNQYLMHGSLATFDGMELTCLIIMAHDMAVRFEIQAHTLNPDVQYDRKLLGVQYREMREDYGYKISMDEFARGTRPYIKLLFHQRQREGEYSKRHPTLENSMEGFRKGNKRYV